MVLMTHHLLFMMMLMKRRNLNYVIICQNNYYLQKINKKWTKKGLHLDSDSEKKALSISGKEIGVEDSLSTKKSWGQHVRVNR